MRMRLDRISWLLMAGSALLSMLAVWMVLRTVADVRVAGDWVQHTLIVQSELNNLRAELLRSQSQTRGYVLTGDARTRARAAEAIENSRRAVNYVRQLTQDNPKQQSAIDRVDAVASPFLAELNQLLAVRAQEGAAAAAARLVAGGEGALGIEVRLRLLPLKQEEEALLRARITVELQNQQLAQTLIIGFGAVAFISALAGIFVVRADRRRIARAEANLAALNAGLEQQVEQRTRTIAAEQARIQSIFDAMSDGVNTLDRDWRYTFVSRRAGQLLRRDPETMIGRRIWDLYPDLEHSEMRQLLDRALGSGKAQAGEIHLENYNNVWYSFHATPGPEGITVYFHDVTRRHRQEQKLREFSQRMEQLSRRLIAAEEEQRRILARELHDEIGQSLTAIKFNFAALAKTMPAPLAPRAYDGLALTGRIIGQVRDRLMELRPALLDDQGLSAAVQEYVTRQAGRTGVRFDFAQTPPLPRLPGEIETTAFRVVQEAIHNALRHSGCALIEVNLECADHQVLVEVRDDGKGFDARTAPESARLGLAGMRERVGLLGGRFAVDSTPGRGAVVRAALPVEAAAEAA